MAQLPVETNVTIEELSRDDGYAMLDRLSKQCCNMGVDDFISAWESGAFDDDPDNPEIMRLVMLLPFVQDGR